MPYNEPRHRGKLTAILKDLFDIPEFAANLAFKGGTAAYLLYGLTRGSLDLDFDIVSEKTDEELIRTKVRNVLTKHGRIKNYDVTHHGVYFEVSYNTMQDDNNPNIKVDINRRHFGSSYEPMNYEGTSMRVMTKPDMLANKLVALTERNANRDIYDVWYFLKQYWEPNEKIIKLRTEKNLREHLERCIHKLETMSDVHILHGMGELLTPKSKAWAKQHLRQETITELRRLIDTLPKEKDTD